MSEQDTIARLKGPLIVETKELLFLQITKQSRVKDRNTLYYGDNIEDHGRVLEVHEE